jgi:hypothetical protein
MRFQVLMAASMKITAFWDIASHSLVEVSEVRTASIFALMMEAVRPFKRRLLQRD